MSNYNYLLSGIQIDSCIEICLEIEYYEGFLFLIKLLYNSLAPKSKLEEDCFLIKGILVLD